MIIDLRFQLGASLYELRPHKITQEDDVANRWKTWLEFIQRYLDCGELHFGFARVKCEDGGHEYLLAYSCKRRLLYLDYLEKITPKKIYDIKKNITKMSKFQIRR